MSKPVSRGLFVLGMHRSGTSCLTGLLETSGVFMGDVARKKRPGNPKGNLENVPARKLNESILDDNGGSWKSVPRDLRVSPARREEIAAVLASFGDHPRWALKDPRLLLVLDAWLEADPDVALVGTFRHPLAVARSLQARNDLPLEEGCAIWLRYNEELVAQHRRRRFPLVSFDRVGDAYLDQYRALCRRLDLPFDETAAGEFYASDLVRQAASEPEPPPPEAREVLEYLESHAG